jgi:hypothetical protein
MPVFSSIETTIVFSGGLRYRPQTSAAWASKAAESSDITQYSVRCGRRSASRRIACACERDIPTSAASSP